MKSSTDKRNDKFYILNLFICNQEWRQLVKRLNLVGLEATIFFFCLSPENHRNLVPTYRFVK